jgi:CDP-glycerol glycerophosphotransferase (TagB/SpsB family)
MTESASLDDQTPDVLLDGHAPSPVSNLWGRIDGIDPIEDGGLLRLTGRHGRGDDLELPSHQVSVVVIGPDGDVAARLDSRTTPRFEAGQRRNTGWSADLPIAGLPAGGYTLDLELEGTPGHDSPRIPVKVSAGVLATSRPVVFRDRRIQVFPVHGSNRAELIMRRATGAGSLLRWRMMSLRRDLGSMLRGRPFAWIRPVRWITRPMAGRKPVWLIGERPDTARDNGYHLFAYLRRERPDIRAYYVIERSSEAHAKVSALGPVVLHSSWRHRLLMLHATALLNAYSLKHMVPGRWNKAAYMRHASWRIGSYRVYLKHGVNEATKTLKRHRSGFDLYLTATEAETRAARETSGYDRQIVLTGLPRYDALIPTPLSRTVLFMPTWRMYLTPRLFSDETEAPVAYEGSTYQRFMDDLFTSPRLLEMLERHDYRFELLPHYNMRAHLSEMERTSDRISVLDATTPDIQDVMRRCDLFITDHSSVNFDLAYLGTPMIYTHFDDEEYHAGHAHPSWFDHARDGFGPVTHDLDSTLDAIEHYLTNGCVREELYSRRAGEAFVFHDQDSSRRAVEAVEDVIRRQGVQ